MEPIGQQIAALADGQHRVAARMDLLDLGLSSSAIHRRVRGGVLHPKHPGIYAVGTPTLTPRGVTYAGVRWVGADGAAAGASAAGLLELGGWLPPVPQVLTTRPAVRGSGVVVRTTRSLPPEDVQLVDGIRTLTPTRLLLDAAAMGDDRRLERWVKQARRLRLLDEGALLERSHGAPGGRLLRTLLALEPGPDAANAFEDAFAAIVARAGLPAPQREVPMGRFRLDFWWPDLWLAAETDSWKDHGHRRGFEGDRERDVELFNEFDVYTLRFTTRKVFHAPAWVADQLVRAAAKQAALRHDPRALAARRAQVFAGGALPLGLAVPGPGLGGSAAWLT